MDAQQFLAEFGHIANAPGGVARLREMVLALAVTGRLTQGDKAESTPTINLIKIIERELADYKKAHKYRRSKGDVESKPNVSFSAPFDWFLVRLGQIGTLIRGVSYNKSVARDSAQDGFTGLLRATNIGSDVTFNDLVYVPSKIVDEEQLLQPGDILIAMSSGSKDLVGKAALVRNNTGYAFGAFCGVYRCMPSMSSEFIRVVMQSPIYRTYVSDQGKGIGINNLTKGHIENYQFYLPPIEEQSRIVAKVDELMTLCDKLEAQQQQRRSLQNNLRQSTLQAVAAAASPHELHTSWTHVTDNFDQLFHAPEDLFSLKSLILGLAVRGLVVEQSSADTPAKELLKNIDTERQKLIAAKKLKAGVTLPPVSSAELPYQLPKGWVWARVIDLVDVGTGATPAKSEPSYYGGDVPWYTSSATNDKFAKHPEKFITQKAINETNCKVFPSGSLIVALYGQGKTRGQISELLMAGATNQALAAMVFFESSLGTKRYLKYFFEKIYDEIRLQAEGGPQPNLNVGKIKETLIPVPPLEEQHRIIAKLDQLLSTCDQLSNKLRSSNTVAKRLAVASVASLTGITTEQQEDEPMKVPQTKLIAPLRLGQVPGIKAQAPLATILARHNGEISAKDLWQRFGGEIDAFYAQLKTEVNHGWILEPEVAEMQEKFSDRASA